MEVSAYEGRQADLAPLAVDLDRTLIKTDSLVEQFLTVLCKSPWQALKTLLRLREGKARFKEALIDISVVDAEVLLFNEELLEYLRAERDRGRELHLVTAADQSVADVVAEKTGLFVSATGSTEGHNLKGMNKLEHLRERFPDGFSYAGDSRADVVIWRHARSAVLVGVRNSTRRIVGGLDCVVEHEIDRRLPGLRDWMKLFRVHQWSKNILLFVPLILGQSFTNLHAVAAVVIGFVAMGMAASGTYVINDISDIAADRAHATKRFRPIANGVIDAGHALLIALAMVAAGVSIMALLSPAAAGWLLVYLAGTLSYSFAFKRMPMIDIFVLGGLYTLRVVIGVHLVGALMSHWLLMFSFFFFFSLSMAKRHVEIANAARRLGDGVQIKGRGYRTGDAPLTLAMGIGTNLVALLILSLYVASDIYPRQLYNDPQWLWGIVILVMMWSSRIWLLSHRGELDDDPVSFAIRDPLSILIGLATGVLFVLSMT